MKKQVFFLLMSTLIVCGLSTSCNDDLGTGMETFDSTKGFLTLNLSLSEATRGGTTVNGASFENIIEQLDVFFFTSDAGEDTPATYAIHESSSDIKSVNVSINTLKEKFGETATSCKVIAVANCTKTKTLTAPTFKDLKAITVTDIDKGKEGYAFRSTEAPKDFVMTNFAQVNNTVTPNTVTWTEDGGEGTIQLKRVAAKIRVALNVKETITDENGMTWEADLKDMRLFISNGVTKARLDGSHDVKLESSKDYYSIVTTGSKGGNTTNGGEEKTDDYKLAHKLEKHDNQTPKAPENEEYLYYNAVPYYTYPNSWENAVLETTQTTLTIVVPWQREDKEGGKTIYKPSYYTIPVNNGTTIESNKYYYIRMHIGMMGSVTPEKPMEVDMQCEIADWGQAEDTNVNIRPVRYLIFNQTEFVMNNTTEIEIPFMSTHDCKVEKFSGKFYTFYGNYGDKIDRNFGKSFKGQFFDYEIDDVNHVLKFNHHFFEYWRPTYNSDNSLSSLLHSETESRSGSNTNPVVYARLFSSFDVEMVVTHDVGDGNDLAYQETIKITVYPAVYVNVDNISTYGRNRNDGWIMINGYGTSNAGTGNLEDFGRAIDSGDAGALTILTANVLNPQEKEKWVLDDPRTYYINNELSTASMSTDNSDHMQTWTNGNGPFNGTQTGSSRGGVCKMIWDYFPTASSVDWNNTTWTPTDDNSARALNYYYPASELEGKSNILAPKIIVCSYHSFSGSMSWETARRRCAAFQQYGYPAGRWRLPTGAEIAIFKLMQKYTRVNDIFYRDISANTSGVGTNWSNAGATGNGETFGKSGNSYVRCVYDLWYWEKVDANGVSTARIPEGNNRENWKIFTWGDRPKENPLTRSGGDSYTVQDYLEENAQGNYAITRDGNKVKRIKMK